MIRNIPLNKLVLSDRNVRRASDPWADLELKADIEARGLLQNLVVTSTRKPKGFFAVEAGGRRLRALQALVEDGKVGPGHEICCLVLGDHKAAREASLAENFQRLAMNPADECIAFRQLVETGADPEGIARRFGLTTRFVEGRLRLALLAPVVFEALGAGEIGLEVAKAYGTTPDQERQAYVFERMQGAYGATHPDSIRRMMTQETASATDRRARFVGEEAYVAAGGRIERDLFSEDAATQWLDVAILERLAGEKLEAMAGEAAAKAGVGWVRPTLDEWICSRHTAGLERVTADREPLTDAEKEEIAVLESEADGLAATIEDEDASEEARSNAERRVEEISARIEALGEKPILVDPELKRSLGTFLMLDDEGRPCLHTSVYAELPQPDAVEEEGHDDAVVAESDATGRKAGTLSQRLIDELAMQRRDILAAHVAFDPDLALDLANFLMADRKGYPHEPSGSSLVARHPSDPVVGFETPCATASRALERAAEQLDMSWTEGETRSVRFDAFRALSRTARDAWLAHSVARTLEASLNLPGQHVCAFHDHLGELLDIDVARWWRPTGLNFFDRVPKGVTLDVLRQVGGPALADRHAKAKKTELSQSCERIFAGDFIAEPEVKQAALAWVPEPMMFAAAREPEPAGGEDAEEGADATDPAEEAPVPGPEPVEPPEREAA